MTRTVVAMAVVCIACVFSITAQLGLKCSCAEDAREDVLFWTCSMHPSVKMPDPGTCPICAMKLVPVRRDSREEGQGRLELSETAARLAEIETAAAVEQDVSTRLRLPGSVAYDETKIAEVSAWAGGRIEKLFVNFTGDYVRRGKPLCTLYSPALNTAQQEYLTAWKRAGNAGADALSASVHANARRKLILMGISPAQIQELERRGSAVDFMQINAPVSGVVLQRDVLEGGYVETGERMFRIAQLENLWVELEVYERDAAQVAVGLEADFAARAYPGEMFTGRVAYVDPFLNPDTRTLRARVDMPNPDLKLKPGMFGYAVITVPLGRHLVVPASAVMLTGTRSLVYVETGPLAYEPREVVLLPRAGDVYPVASGLGQGERVVTRGNFKLDASAQIRGQGGMVQLLDSSANRPQTHCPVMGGEINRQMYTDVKGYRIYVCCPGCTEAIEKDPDTYIEKLKQQGVTPERTPPGAGSAGHHGH